MDLELLRQRSPELAELIERWQSKYERVYDLTDTAEQAALYEGLLEAARQIASASSDARVKLNVSNDGVSGLTVTATPIPPHGAS
jgi:hypothetical protein